MSTRRSIIAAVFATIMILFVVTPVPTAEPDLEQQVDALTARITALENEMLALRTSVRSAHPDPATERAAAASLQGIQALVRSGDTRQASQEMSSFMEQYANTKAGKQARNLHQELSVVGKVAPDTWSIDRWFQGEAQFDSSSAGPTVVVFWETWCPHCRREVPKLQKVYEDYRDQGLQMVGLSRLSKNATEATMRSFIAEHGLDFPLAKENGTLSAHFGVSGIPAAAVVLNGEVVWRGHPARLSRSMIDSWVQ